MNFRERHQDKNDFDLLSMIEYPESYTPECLLVIKEIVEERNIPETEFEQMLLEINLKKARTNLVNLDPINDEIKIHESQYLEKEAITNLYLSEMEKLLKEKEGFRFDVWKYAIGGI